MTLRALAIALTLAIAGCSGGGGGKSAPVWGILYSEGMPEVPTLQGDGFTFDFPSAGHVNYVVREPTGPLATRLTIVGSVAASPGTVFRFDTNANNTCPGTANFRLYFQRRGDDMSGNGPMEFYRWWSTTALALEPGPFSSSSALTDPSGWISVYGKRGDATPEITQAFNDARANPNVVGMTFGGGCFAGHGVFVSGGTASFTVNRFTME